MKILHIVAAPAAGGAEIYVRDLSEAFSLRGHEVLIVFLFRSEVIGRSVGFESIFLNDLDKAGINYTFLNVRPKLPVTPSSIYRFRRIVRQFSPDILHAHLHYAVLSSAFLPCHVVYTHHSVLPLVPRIFWKISKVIVKEYVGISDACKTMIEGITSRRATKIENGVKLDNFRNLRSTGDSGGKNSGSKIRILAVGRYTAAKNYSMLAQVAHALQKFVPGRFVIVLAGEGTEQQKKALQDEVEQLGVSDQFELVGQSDDIATLMAESDIFVMTSKSEGMPISLLEACIAGLPSVVTDVGGCAEVIECCRSGYIIPSGDVAEFTEQLRLLICDLKLRASLSDAARENSSYYSIENSYEKHNVLYKKILG